MKIRSSFQFCLLFFLFIFIIAAPFRSEATEATEAIDDASSKNIKYTIGPGDILEIVVWRNSELSREAIVRPDGAITLNLMGEVQAAGLTPLELKVVLTERLKTFKRQAEISVIVKEVNSYNIYILGEVRNPGAYPLKRKTTLIQAIALAGGFDEYASENKIMVIRERDGKDGKEEKIKVRFKDIINAKKVNDKNLILRPGDTIFVP